MTEKLDSIELGICYMPGIMLGPRNSLVNKKDTALLGKDRQ